MTAPSQSLKELFLAAIEVAPDSRAAWLERECRGDAELHERLRLMVAAHDSPQSLLDRPGPANAIARAVAEGAGATTDSTIADRAGTVIGRYKLLQQIGEGGMGVVYLAEQSEPVKRRVALKIIKPGMDSRQVIARFEAERQALSLMDHPNIAKVLDAGTTESGRPFFVMELVKGQPITQYCDERHLTTRQRLELLLPVCQAIQHAHQKGIIHRDIKPTNILVAEYDQQPVPKVIDFGVAKAISQSLTEKTMFTGVGQIVGTLEYMSPEQAKVNQLDIDTRSDIYSLGVLLYELLTGSTPFDKQRLCSAGWDEMLRIIREEEPPKPSTKLSESKDTLPSISAQRQTEPSKLTKLVRGELDWIVMKALEKDRNRRYETANGLAIDIQRYLADEPVVACPPSTAYRFRKFARRNKTFLATTGVVALSLIAGITGTTWQAIQATHERDRAVAAERLAQERLEKEQTERLRAESAESQAKVEAKRADGEAQKARTEAAIAEAVNQFLTTDLLAQADPRNEPDRDITLRTVLDRAAAKIDGRFPEKPLVEAAIRITIHNSYVALGQFETAQIHLDRALELRQENLGNEHPLTLSATHELGWLRIYQSQPDEAARILAHNLKLRRQVLGDQHESTLSSMFALGFAYRCIRRFDECERLYLDVLEIRRRVLGEEDLATVASMDALAALYREQGRYTESETLFLKTLEMRLRVLGEDNPHTLYTMINLAELHRLQRKYDEAERLGLKALALQRSIFGETHHRIRECADELSQLYATQGRYAEAEQWSLRALEVQRTLHQERPNVSRLSKGLAEAHIKHGILLAKMDQWSQATTEFSRALELVPETFHRVFGEVHSNGKLAEAEKLMRIAHSAFEKRVAEHPTDASCRKELATIEKFLGMSRYPTLPREAENHFRRTSATYEELLSGFPGNADYLEGLADAYYWQALCRDRTTEPQERERLFKQAATHMEASLKGEHRDQYRRMLLVQTYLLLADDLAAEQRAEEAEANYRKAIEVIRSLAADTLDASPPNLWRRNIVNLCFINLIKLLTAANRTQEAKQVYEQAITFYAKLAAKRPDEPYFGEALTKHQAALAKLNEKK